MKIRCFHVDAFTRQRFGGNPAAVCLLDHWLPDDLLQRISAEFNLSETAFIVDTGDRLELRWFTPTMEMDLCGHATLASAFVLLEASARSAPSITHTAFHTRSGVLTVSLRPDGSMRMDFPSRPAVPIADRWGLEDVLGAKVVETWKSRDLLVVLESARCVTDLRPDMAGIAKISDVLGVIITAVGEPGSQIDFVSRFFAPRAGVPEDPVTGSAHCTLTPYWAARLGKTTLMARQVSDRGGELVCDLMGDRVGISGHAVLFYQGQINLATEERGRAPF